MTNEQIITDFMQKHYTDEKLAALLAHAEDGELAYNSCSCFIGIPFAVGALHGHFCGVRDGCLNEWPEVARETIPEANAAEDEFLNLAFNDADRRAKLIPLIRAEIERRERERSESSSESLPAAVLSV